MEPTDSMPGPKLAVALPPACSSTVLGTNQDEIPGPVAMACQTSSGVPGTSTSAWMERRPSGSFFTGMATPRCLVRGREMLTHPPLPQVLVPRGHGRGPLAVQVQADSHLDFFRPGEGDDGRGAGRRLVESEQDLVQVLPHRGPFHRPGERRQTNWRGPPLAGRRTREAERLAQRLPGRLLSSGRIALQLN